MKRRPPTAARLAQVRQDAQAKRAELGLEPQAPGSAEYEAAMAARKARRKGKR